MNFAETEKTELKQKLTDAFPKEIVAFLNTDGGTIYIGVNDDGSVCGVTNLDEILKKIADREIRFCQTLVLMWNSEQNLLSKDTSSK